jgi:hypothetical protein
LSGLLKCLELNDNNVIELNRREILGDELKLFLLQNNNTVTLNPQFLNDTLQKLNLGNNKIVNFNPT